MQLIFCARERVFAELMAALVVSFLLIASHSLYAQTIEEVVVTIDFIPDEKLNTAEVAEVLDAEDLSISGDSNIGEALKRLPGLSLVGGKFVYIRGLGERYSSTYFNGTPVPSPEPLQRAVPLDLFDSGIISNVLVQKTYSPNYGAEFTGGVIDIRSAALPSENYFKFNLSTGYNDISTNRNGFTYTGGSDDFWGKDDGTRELPGEIGALLANYNNPSIFSNPSFGQPAAPLIAVQDPARLSFDNNVWEARLRSNPYDLSGSASFGRRMDFDDYSIGVLLVGSHSNNWRNRLVERTRWGQQAFSNFDISQAQAQRESALQSGISSVLINSVENYSRTVNTINSSILATLGAEFLNSHTIKLTKLLTRKTTDEASKRLYRQDEGLLGNGSDIVEETRLQWTENELDFNQIGGEHVFDFDAVDTELKVRWRYSRINAARDTPDTRIHARGSIANFGGGNINDSYTLRIADSKQGVGDFVPRREFSFLDDKNDEYGIDINLPFTTNWAELVTVSMGYSMLEKEREFDSYRFSYNFDGFGLSAADSATLTRSVENVLDPRPCLVIIGIPSDTADECFLATGKAGSNQESGHVTIKDGVVVTGNPPPEAYDAKTKLEAAYIAFDIEFNDVIRINAGLRKERSLQQVLDPVEGGLLQNEADNDTESPELDFEDILPAFSLTWSFYSNMQLRAAYSETMNRPILRELAEVRLFNPEDGRFYVGNSALKIAEVSNWDLRYEWYFGEDDYLSVSAFTKKIDNPIELFDLGAETPEFTWRNTGSVENEGYEIELRKYFGQYWFATANATYIDSEIDLGAASNAVTEIQQGRPLQGLSKELFNAQFVYENETLTASLAYNWFSKRIAAINDEGGGGTAGLDRVLIYEQPFHGLDFNLKYRVISGSDIFILGLKVKNLLNDRVERQYGNGLIYDRYEVGQRASLSFEWQQY